MALASRKTKLQVVPFAYTKPHQLDARQEFTLDQSPGHYMRQKHLSSLRCQRPSQTLPYEGRT